MKVYENGKYRDMTPEEVAEHNKRVVEYTKTAREQEIEDMKQDLASSDYKIIKCMEYYLLGKDLPYDIDKLHEERQNQRNEINKRE